MPRASTPADAERALLAAGLPVVVPDKDDGGPATILPGALPIDSADGALPEVRGARYLSGIGSGASKAGRRALARLTDLGWLLGSEWPRPGRAALHAERGGSGNAVIFAEALFPARRHHVHLRGVTALRREPGWPTNTDEIAVVSGPCLFGPDGLRFVDTAGANPILIGPDAKPLAKRLNEIVATESLSLYEYESVVRLATLVADLARTLPPGLPLTVTIDVPRVQYYFSLFEAFAAGCVDRDLMLRWCDVVDRRHSRLCTLYRQRFHAALGIVGRPVRLRESDPLRNIGPLVRDAVRAGTVPDPGELTRRLRAADPLWRAALDPARLNSIVDIGNAAYVVELLRATGIQRPGPRRLAISVENYEEWRIFDRASAVLRRLDPTTRPPLLGIYPAQRILTVGPDRRPVSLFRMNPGRHAMTTTGRTVDLFHLVDESVAVAGTRTLPNRASSAQLLVPCDPQP